MGHAEEALAALDRETVDAVLTDLHLPDQDGYALARAIRARPADADLPVLAVTANASPEAVEQARAAGMDGLLAKPPDLPRFYATLADALAGRAGPLVSQPPGRAPGPPATVSVERMADARVWLEDVLAAGELAAVAKAAHRLAGVAAFAACPEVAAQARNIENAALDGDLARARSQFEALRSY